MCILEWHSRKASSVYFELAHVDACHIHSHNKMHLSTTADCSVTILLTDDV